MPLFTARCLSYDSLLIHFPRIIAEIQRTTKAFCNPAMQYCSYEHAVCRVRAVHVLVSAYWQWKIKMTPPPKKKINPLLLQNCQKPAGSNKCDYIIFDVISFLNFTIDLMSEFILEEIFYLCFFIWCKWRLHNRDLFEMQLDCRNGESHRFCWPFCLLLYLVDWWE